MGRFFVGITGASGHAYAEALVRGLVAGGHGVDLSITRAGALVIQHELGVDAGERGERLQGALEGWLGAEVAKDVQVFLPEEVGAPPSSGTALGAGAILCPCSMGTMGRVAAGFSSNLKPRGTNTHFLRRIAQPFRIATKNCSNPVAQTTFDRLGNKSCQHEISGDIIFSKGIFNTIEKKC